jgi:hypothetical protein
MKLTLHDLYLLAANLPDPEAVSVKAGRKSYENLLTRIGNQIRLEEEAQRSEARIFTSNTLLDLYEKARGRK